MPGTAAHTYLKSKLIKACRQRGWYVQSNPGNAMSDAGTSDLSVCASGHFFALEVKTGRGKLEPLQRLSLTRVKRSGGVALVVRQVEPTIHAILRYITQGVINVSDDFELDFDDLFDSTSDTTAVVKQAEEIVRGKAMPEPRIPKGKPVPAPVADDLDLDTSAIIERLDRIEAMVKDVRGVVTRLSQEVTSEPGDLAAPHVEDPDNLLDVFEPEDEPIPNPKPSTRGRPKKA